MAIEINWQSASKWYNSLSKDRRIELDEEVPVGLDFEDDVVFFDWMYETYENEIRTFITTNPELF